MATEQLGVGGLTPEAKQFYERQLLMRVRAATPHAAYGLKKRIPARGGRSIEFRRMEAIAGSTTALVEGTPPAETQGTFVTVNATVNQYGQWARISDVASQQSFDAIVPEYMRNFEEAAADTVDILTRNVLVSGTNVQYASTAGSRGQVGSGMLLTLAEIREALGTLKRNDAKPVVDNKFIVIIHPDAWVDFFADANVVNAFLYSKDRGEDNPMTTGVIGDLLGARFVETTNARIFSSLGLSGADVYATLVCGREAYGVIDYASMGLEVFQEGPGGVTDPLHQVRTIGYKLSHAATILNDKFLVRIEHVTTRKQAA